MELPALVLYVTHCCMIFEQIKEQSKNSKFEEEIKAEQEEKKKEAAEKKQRQADFRAKAAMFASQ